MSAPYVAVADREPPLATVFCINISCHRAVNERGTGLSKVAASIAVGNPLLRSKWHAVVKIGEMRENVTRFPHRW